MTTGKCQNATIGGLLSGSPTCSAIGGALPYCMSSRPKLLVIARYFPPDAEVGGKRIAHLTRWLPVFGIDPIVLTIQERFCEVRDNSFPMPAVRVERTPISASFLDWYARLQNRRASAARAAGGAASSTNGGSPLEAQTLSKGILRRNLSALLQMPDRHVAWQRPAVEAAASLIEREQISAIFSSAPPWTCHMIARRLKRKYRLPWFADFRDPWTFDAWRKLEDLPFWREWIDRRWECSCVTWADRVVCVTDRMTQQFAANYPNLSSSKFLTLTNGFDDSLAPVVRGRMSDCGTRLILHLGTLYGDRRIDTFCCAVSNLIAEGTLQRGSFRVLFVGSIDDPHLVDTARDAAPDLFASGSIEFRPAVSWEQARQLLCSADLLLIFQGSNQLTIPGKFYEYLQSGIPILSIVKPGALSSISQETGSGYSADPDDPEQIGALLMRALSLPIRLRDEVMRAAGHYRFSSLAEQLAGWIHELVAASAPSRDADEDGGEPSLGKEV